MKHVWWTAGVGLVMACAAGSRGEDVAPAHTPLPVTATTEPKPVTRRPLPLPEVVRYGPSTTRYRVQRHLHVEQAYGGQLQVQELGAQIFVRVTITGPADAGGYPVTFTIDSVLPDSATPAVVADNMTRVRALILAGRLTPEGEFRGSTSIDSSMAQNVAQLVGNFRDFLPRIPAAGVRVGAAWVDTVSAVQRSGSSEITRQGVLRSTAPAWEEHAGARSVRIEAASTYSVMGSGQNSGQPFELSGAGAATTRTFLAEDGRFVGGESRDSTTLTITLPVQRLSIPVSQVLSSSVVTLP